MKVSVADAKNKLPELIKAVEDGESVTICRRGRPVVDIVRTSKSNAKSRSSERLIAGGPRSRAGIGSTDDRGGRQTGRALPSLKGGARGFGGLIDLVQQALAHQTVDYGQVGERLPELDPAIGPGPQAFAM